MKRARRKPKRRLVLAVGYVGGWLLSRRELVRPEDSAFARANLARPSTGARYIRGLTLLHQKRGFPKSSQPQVKRVRVVVEVL